MITGTCWSSVSTHLVFRVPSYGLHSQVWRNNAQLNLFLRRNVGVSRKKTKPYPRDDGAAHSVRSVNGLLKYVEAVKKLWA